MSRRVHTPAERHEGKPHTPVKRAGKAAPGKTADDTAALLQHMQRTAGNAAVNALLAQRSARSGGGFQRMDVGALMRVPDAVYAALMRQRATVDDVQGEAARARKEAGSQIVEQAVTMLETAQSTIAGAIPLAAMAATRPQTAGAVAGILTQVLGQVSQARGMLDDGLALQGRIQKGAPPGASIGKDGMPLNEGGWKNVRLQIMRLEMMLTAQAGNPFAPAGLIAQMQHQIMMAVIACRQQIAKDQIADAIAKATAASAAG